MKKLYLSFGVVDTPYDETRAATGEVANYLEGDFGVMGRFVKLHKGKITQSIRDDIFMELKGAALRGRPIQMRTLKQASAEIKVLFNKFIDSEEHGIHTKASLERRSTRKKNRTPTKGVSFVDTGAYRRSFKMWRDE